MAHPATGNSVPLLKEVANRLTAVAVADLPAVADSFGQIRSVNDATAPAVGSEVADGGAAAALVWSNGATWTVIGK